MGDLRPPYRPDDGFLQQAQVGGFQASELGHVLLNLDLGHPPHTQTISDVFGHDYPGLLQEWVTLFIGKQKDYGDSADDLGAPGQYSELHRKMGKLKKALWDGEALAGEQPDEVLFDLIGHCFLAIRHLRNNNYGGKPTK
jgi:hypothetical protein